MPRLREAGAMCEGQCVSGRRRAGVDREGAGEVNRGHVLKGQVKKLAYYSKELWSHGRLSTVRFAFLKNYPEWCGK